MPTIRKSRNVAHRIVPNHHHGPNQFRRGGSLLRFRSTAQPPEPDAFVVLETTEHGRGRAWVTLNEDVRNVAYPADATPIEPFFAIHMIMNNQEHQIDQMHNFDMGDRHIAFPWNASFRLVVNQGMEVVIS